MNPFELVIFDCDGVLVDSERITNTVFCTMLNELGLPLTLEDMFDQFVGNSMPQCVELIQRMLGRDLPEDFVPNYRLRTESALRARITPIAGVAEVLSGLCIPYCVASSGSHEKIRLTLGTTGLLKSFEGRIFSVVDVARPKPSPDVFLLAARTLNADPTACAVVEDTPIGVRAGIAAGMHVFGFSANTPQHRLEQAGAHAIFSEMSQLPSLLRRGIG